MGRRRTDEFVLNLERSRPVSNSVHYVIGRTFGRVERDEFDGNVGAHDYYAGTISFLGLSRNDVTERSGIGGLTGNDGSEGLRSGDPPAGRIGDTGNATYLCGRTPCRESVARNESRSRQTRVYFTAISSRIVFSYRRHTRRLPRNIIVRLARLNNRRAPVSSRAQ